MKILITGNKGFVGSHLVDRLKGHTLAGIDKKDGGEIVSEKFLLSACRFKPEMVVHLAANCSTSKSIDNPIADFKDNAQATLVICEIARITGAKVIYTSSCKIEPNHEGLRSPYGLSKYVGELYLKEYFGIYGVEYIVNRPGTIYGDGQQGSPESGWLSWFIKAKKENLPITIYGDGKQSRDVLWVSDYIELLADQIDNWEKYKNMTYTVGGGEDNEVTLLQALSFLKYKNYRLDKERPGDTYRFVSDNKRVSAVNGWKPTVDWQEGIRRLL